MTQTQAQSGTDKKYRLITRSDMDGLVCGVLLRTLGMVDEITFAHPKDMQDGKIEVGPNDITTNLPYVDGVHLCFDHHASELERLDEIPPNHVIDPDAPSAARVVFNYFDGNVLLKDIPEEMMIAVDKADSARFTKEDVMTPEGWELLSFIMDARTGLGRFRDFGISNYQLMMKLVEYCSENHPIEDLLALPDIKERVELYFEHHTKFREQIERCSTVHNNLIVLDLRKEETIWAGNRFMIYALFPQCNISMHVIWGKNKQNTVFAVGKSIMNRTSDVSIGNLMLEYGGGGHAAAGTCQIDNLKAEDVKQELIKKLSS